MARTAVLGEPSGKLKRYWNAINQGVKLAVDMVEPSANVSEIFITVMERVRSSGISHYRRHHVGHGLGLEGYDPPLISLSETQTIEEDMVLCLETPYYEVGWGVIQVEDIVKVNQNNCEYLTRIEPELRVIG